MKLQHRIASGIVTVLAVIGVSVVLLHRPRPPKPLEAKAPVHMTNALAIPSLKATNATLSSLPETQSRHGARFDPLQLIRESLALTDDQTKKLLPILKEQQSKMVALRRDTALSREDRLAKVKEMQLTWESRVKSVLTPEQVEKWRNLKFTPFNKQ